MDTIKPNSTTFNLDTYRNGSSKIEIPIEALPEARQIVTNSIERYLLEWEGNDFHMKEKHGQDAFDALHTIHHYIVSGDSENNVIFLAKPEIIDQRSILVTTQNPVIKIEDTSLSMVVGAYLSQYERSKREDILKYLMTERMSISDRLMFSAAASIAGMNPAKSVRYTASERRELRGFLKDISELTRNSHILDEDYEYKVLKAAAKNQITELEGIFTRRRLGITTRPRMFMDFNPKKGRLNNIIRTAFIRRSWILREKTPRFLKLLIYDPEEQYLPQPE